MKDLLQYLKFHFDNLQNRFISFHDSGVQVEGWFKGELLLLFDQLKQYKLINDYDREIKIDRKKIDLSISINSKKYWVELKHWLNGRQRDYNFTPTFYFPDHTSVGIIKDVEKLVKMHGQKWLIILVTKNPGLESWKAGLEKFHKKYPNYKLISHSTPCEFPPSYFIGLLEVKKNNKRKP